MKKSISTDLGDMDDKAVKELIEENKLLRIPRPYEQQLRALERRKHRLEWELETLDKELEEVSDRIYEMEQQGEQEWLIQGRAQEQLDED
jgi:hypothetical protein